MILQFFCLTNYFGNLFGKKWVWIYNIFQEETFCRNKLNRRNQLGLSEATWELFWGTTVSLTQDINVTVLHIVDTLLNRLIAAHIQRQQHHGLAKRVSCRLHQIVLFPQVAHGGNDCENRGVQGGKGL